MKISTGDTGSRGCKCGDDLRNFDLFPVIPVSPVEMSLFLLGNSHDS